MPATIVVETYNLTGRQRFERLSASLAAAARAARLADGGPHSVLLVDGSDDPRTEGLVAAQTVPVRHVRVPAGATRDMARDLAAERAETEVVAFLDGGCVPLGEPARWLEALLGTLHRTGAPGVAGTVLYDGWAPLALAATALDFGFLHDDFVDGSRGAGGGGDDGGQLGCHRSTNTAFWRHDRVAEASAAHGRRGAGVVPPQAFVHQGRPMRHAASPDAVVRQTLPPLLGERLRRSHDGVAVARIDPSLPDGATSTVVGRRGAPTALLRSYVRGLRLDVRRLRRLRHYTSLGWRSVAGAVALLPVLRLLEVAGDARALWSEPDETWATAPTALVDAYAEGAGAAPTLATISDIASPVTPVEAAAPVTPVSFVPGGDDGPTD
jgi:hypothetical protein